MSQLQTISWLQPGDGRPTALKGASDIEDNRLAKTIPIVTVSRYNNKKSLQQHAYISGATLMPRGLCLPPIPILTIISPVATTSYVFFDISTEKKLVLQTGEQWIR